MLIYHQLDHKELKQMELHQGMEIFIQDNELKGLKII